MWFVGQLFAIKSRLVTKRKHKSRARTDRSLVRHKLWKGDMGFGTWNVRSLYRSGSLTTVARDSARYKLDLVGVQEVRWDKGDIFRNTV